MYIEKHVVPAPLFHIIDRCCSVSKDSRYRALAELKQSLVAAYDVILQRLGGLGKVKQLLSSIREKFEAGGNYDQREILEFVEQLALVDEAEQVRVCVELPAAFFLVIGQRPSVDGLPTFLRIYERLVEGRDYGWSYAEIIASNMGRIFDSEEAPHDEKARALGVAIRAATYMNRFAAMDTCRGIITAIHNEDLGLQVAPILLENRDTFISGIEPSECQSNAIAAAIRQIQQAGGPP